MKKNLIFTIFLMLLCSQTPALAQISAVTPPPNTGDLLAGEHATLIYSGAGSLPGSAGDYTTAWMQVGYASTASNAANRAAMRLDARWFTATVKMANFNVGDSAQVTSAWFECSDDTTNAATWNTDSSNVFISDEAWESPNYGVWRFELLSDTSRVWIAPLRVLGGGYIRLVFSSVVSDTTIVNWSLCGRH